MEPPPAVIRLSAWKHVATCSFPSPERPCGEQTDGLESPEDQEEEEEESLMKIRVHSSDTSSGSHAWGGSRLTFLPHVCLCFLCGAAETGLEQHLQTQTLLRKPP